MHTHAHINFNLQFAKVLEVLQQRLHGVEMRSFLVAFALCKTFYYHHHHLIFEWIACDAAFAELLSMLLLREFAWMKECDFAHIKCMKTRATMNRIGWLVMYQSLYRLYSLLNRHRSQNYIKFNAIIFDWCYSHWNRENFGWFHNYSFAGMSLKSQQTLRVDQNAVNKCAIIT